VHQAEYLHITQREFRHAKVKHPAAKQGLLVLITCSFSPQPNFAVKPTPTSFACWFPARFALRCGLPVALGLFKYTSLIGQMGRLSYGSRAHCIIGSGLGSREFSRAAKAHKIEAVFRAGSPHKAKAEEMASINQHQRFCVFSTPSPSRQCLTYRSTRTSMLRMAAG
jgi:hypothetical protein